MHAPSSGKNTILTFTILYRDNWSSRNVNKSSQITSKMQRYESCKKFLHSLKLSGDFEGCSHMVNNNLPMLAVYTMSGTAFYKWLLGAHTCRKFSHMMSIMSMTLVLKKSKRRNKCALINASFNGGHHNTVCCVLRARYALEEEKKWHTSTSKSWRQMAAHYAFYFLPGKSVHAVCNQRAFRH